MKKQRGQTVEVTEIFKGVPKRKKSHKSLIFGLLILIIAIGVIIGIIYGVSVAKETF